MDTITWIEIVVQLCRLQVQRERDKIMTPKISGLRAAMAQLRSAVEDDADKLMSRIEDAGKRAKSAFVGSHGVLDAMERDVKEVEDFVTGLEGHNGGDPLDDSSSASAPRSSEVANRS